MKHSKRTKAIALLMSMTMITSVFVGNTLSRYVTSVSSTDSARVAVWGINGGTTQMNLFDVSYIKDGKDIAKSNNAATDPEDKIMAPGTSGEAPFSIINFEQDVAPEVAYQVALTFDDSAIADEIKNNPSVQWKLDNGAWGTLEQLKTSILSLSGDASGVKVYEPGQFADAFEDNTPHTISWQWLLDNNETITVDGDDMSSNEYDTYMGNLALTGDLEAVITVGITAEQIDYKEPVELISFTIEGFDSWTVWMDEERGEVDASIPTKTYQAEKGMTWKEWVDSPYNIDGYIYDENWDRIMEGKYEFFSLNSQYDENIPGSGSYIQNPGETVIDENLVYGLAQMA